MHVRKNVADLDSPRDDLLLRQERCSALQQAFQVLTLDELQYQIAAITLAETIKDFGDGGMAQSGQDIRLPLEILDTQFTEVGVGSGVDHLLDGTQSGNLGKTLVPGLVDGAHASYGYRPDDLVSSLKNSALGKCGSFLEQFCLVTQDPFRFHFECPSLPARVVTYIYIYYKAYGQ